MSRRELEACQGPDEDRRGVRRADVPSEVQSISMAKAIGAMAPASHIEATDESFMVTIYLESRLAQKHRHAASEQS